jgi:16S rRNA (cytosine967-C5)-methyltransferase
VAPPTPSRIAALDTLRAVRGGALAGRAFDAAARALNPRDRAWTRELVYGTLRLRGRLDFRIAQYSKRSLDALDADVLDVLRLGAYQLLEMGGVPPYAAVSQSVELAKRAAGRGAGGFVNGVLQSLRRAGAHSTFPAFDADPIAHLTTWGSHPQWLVERWLARFGAADTRRLVDANNRRPELYLRVLGEPEAGRARLAACGTVVAAVRGVPRALHVPDAEVGTALAEAPVIVQDPAAGLVVTYADVAAGGVVLDLAAAPGGKSLGLAGERPGRRPALVVASDVSAARLERVRLNLERLRRAPPQGLGDLDLALVVADGRRPPFRGADAVLLDAPCTGTGTLRRHPDGRWRIGPPDLAALVQLQRELLDAAAALVRPQGLLVYATCSLEPEENELQVRGFLERRPDFVIDAGDAVTAPFAGNDGALYVLPHRDGWDGAYAARLRRRGSDHAR